MKNKKLIVISILLILCIAGIVYLTSFNLNAFNEKVYRKEFKRYNVYGEFPDKDIDNINSELLLYLKDKQDDFNKELFNGEEVEHLKDVKMVIQKINIFNYLTLIVSVLLLAALFLLDRTYFFRNLSKVLFFGGLFTLFSVVALLILIKLNFDGVFTVFHYIFFPGGGWLFSSSDNIIRLYPSGFFYDMAKKIFVSIILYGNILILAAILLFWIKND